MRASAGWRTLRGTAPGSRRGKWTAHGASGRKDRLLQSCGARHKGEGLPVCTAGITRTGPAGGASRVLSRRGLRGVFLCPDTPSTLYAQRTRPWALDWSSPGNVHAARASPAGEDQFVPRGPALWVCEVPRDLRRWLPGPRPAGGEGGDRERPGTWSPDPGKGGAACCHLQAL